ncbi:MAG TPA: twin-arginine translocase TatA/TatE family subunit [Planctomycetota bacterium]|nr:twin-arginine translocase TatA/TatE family subunit [Planctomycetota bacterium]
MGSFGFEEMLVVAVVAILAFGKDLPQFARKAGKWYGKIKRQLSDMKEEIVRQIPEDIDEDEFRPPPGKSDPDPGHGEPPSPSAGLPGPDPSDPEYKESSSFDPARGPK